MNLLARWGGIFLALTPTPSPILIDDLRTSERLDKEAPSMQIKCCFHNHSSVPLSEVRFARSFAWFFVIKVKGTFTRGRSTCCSPNRPPRNSPRSSSHPHNPPWCSPHPSSLYLILSLCSFWISINESSSASSSCAINQKELFAPNKTNALSILRLACRVNGLDFQTF